MRQVICVCAVLCLGVIMGVPTANAQEGAPLHHAARVVRHGVHRTGHRMRSAAHHTAVRMHRAGHHARASMHRTAHRMRGALR